MSKFTTEVRFICEQYAGLSESVGYDKINEVIHESHEKVMGEYPIFDEEYREVLDTKILRHYYTREICEETVGLWKLRLNTRMNEIMPYYNKMYESELIKFNPMYDIDLNKTQARNTDTDGDLTSVSNETNNESREIGRNGVDNRAIESNGNTSVDSSSKRKSEEHSGTNGNVEGETESKSIDRYSDTPQGGLQGMESIEENLYLTSADINDANGKTKEKTNQQTDSTGISEESGGSNTTDIQHKTDNRVNSETVKEGVESNGTGYKNEKNKINTTEDYLEHVQGKRGGRSYSSLLVEYRESFINIDKMIIDELSDLFFGLWE